MFEARFPGKCGLCGKVIEVGQPIQQNGTVQRADKVAREFVHAVCASPIGPETDAWDDDHETQYDDHAAAVYAAHTEAFEPFVVDAKLKGILEVMDDGYGAEASDLRLPVGVWPMALEIPTFPVFLLRAIDRDSDDVRGARYATKSGTKLTVWND